MGKKGRLKLKGANIKARVPLIRGGERDPRRGNLAEQERVARGEEAGSASLFDL